MNDIDSSDLYSALQDLGVECKKPAAVKIRTVRMLHDVFGEMFSDRDLAVEVPNLDPRKSWIVSLYSGNCYSSGGLLSESGKVFRFGFTKAGEELFVSELDGGKVGLVFDLPENEEDIDFKDKTGHSIIFWDYEFIDWLIQLKAMGRKLFE